MDDLELVQAYVDTGALVKEGDTYAIANWDLLPESFRKRIPELAKTKNIVIIKKHQSEISTN